MPLAAFEPFGAWNFKVVLRILEIQRTTVTYRQQDTTTRIVSSHKRRGIWKHLSYAQAE
jgi:hypothetical protein